MARERRKHVSGTAGPPQLILHQQLNRLTPCHPNNAKKGPVKRNETACYRLLLRSESELVNTFIMSQAWCTFVKGPKLKLCVSL